jgi:hypothetical protein
MLDGWQSEDCATTVDEDGSAADVDDVDEDAAEDDPYDDGERRVSTPSAASEGDAAEVSLKLKRRSSTSNAARRLPSGTNPEERCIEERLELQLQRLGTRRLIAAWAKVLEQLVVLRCNTHCKTLFHATRTPQISISDYMKRISHYFNCSDACLTLGLVYIDRLMKMHPEFIVNTMNVHRLFATSVVIAAKYHDDTFYTNKHYARVAGVKPQELSTLEEQFLLMIGWRLYVDPGEYEQYLRQGVFTVARQGNRPRSMRNHA